MPAEPTPEELRMLAVSLEWDWEEDLPPADEADGKELPILVQTSEVIALVMKALVRGIEIGRQHPTQTQET